MVPYECDWNIYSRFNELNCKVDTNIKDLENGIPVNEGGSRGYTSINVEYKDLGSPK